MESLGIIHRNLGAHIVLVCTSQTDVKLSGFSKLMRRLHVMLASCCLLISLYAIQSDVVALDQARDVYLSENYITASQASGDEISELERISRHFWAPEVALDQNFSTKSDVYAFGL
jgi:serine/threonine protein kinase